MQSLPILGEPGKPNSSPGSLSWVSPAGAEYLPLTPKHADPHLGTLGSCVSILPSVLTPPGLLPPFSPPFLITPRSWSSCGRGWGWDESGCPRQRRQSPHPHWPGGEAGLGAGFRLRGAGWRRPCSRGAGGGGAQGVRAALGAAQCAVSAGLGGGGCRTAKRAASRVRAAARMAGAAGGARARRPGLPSERPQLLCLPGGPPDRRR